jgi:uncharacterized membrane protein HdeD (DUF308 family)
VAFVLDLETDWQPAGLMMDTASNILADRALMSDMDVSPPPINPIWLVVFGIVLVALGAIAFINIVTATIVSVYFVAIGMVMAGIAEIALGLQSRSQRRKMTWVLVGTLYIVAGLFAFFNPVLAAGVLTLMLGASLIGTGIVRLLLALQMRSESRWRWMALSAGVTTVLGMMFIAQWPTSSLYILGVFLSADLIFAGLCWVVIGTATLSWKADATETMS